LKTIDGQKGTYFIRE